MPVQKHLIVYCLKRGNLHFSHVLGNGLLGENIWL